MSTYIKMYRALLDHELLSNDNTAYIVFTKILLKASWKTGTYRTGRKKLGLLTNLKDTTAWAALHRLANDGALTLTPTGRYTDISICNWWEYQGNDAKPVDKSVTRTRTSTDTIQENKKKETIYTADMKAALTLLNEKTGRSFEIAPPSLKHTLAKFSIEQIGNALERLIKDDWHKPKLGLLSANYLLRVDVIDKYLSVSEEKVAKKALDPVLVSQRMHEMRADRNGDHFQHTLETMPGSYIYCTNCKTVIAINRGET